MLLLAATLALTKPDKVATKPYQWKSVSIVAGGFVSGILFHPKQKGLAYCRTDIGGAYRWDSREKHWIPLQDWLTKPDWNLYGIESIGLDPSDPKRLYLACGTYTNDWAGNGAILRSDDQGRTFQRTDLPFKNGGNEDGRSIGERLAVDPNDGRTLFFGTRNNGLWISHDLGATWSQSTSFPVRERTNGIGIGVVVFDPRTPLTKKPASPSQTIYVGVASNGSNLYRSTDAGASWTAVVGQPSNLFPHHMVLAQDGNLIITYSNGPGPNGIGAGAVWKYDTASSNWKEISPEPARSFGYAGLAVDPQDPKIIAVSTLDRWSQGDDVFRTTDGGVTWSAMRQKSIQDSSAAPYMTWGKDKATFGWWTGALAMDPFNTSHILYGTGANIWGSDDVANVDQGLPTHWKVEGLGIEEIADIDLLSPPEGPHLISAVGDIGGFTHIDLDKTPPGGMTVNPMFGSTDSIDFAADAPSKLVRVGRGSEAHGAYSTDAGLSWKPFLSEPSKAAGGSVAISADASTVVWSPDGQPPTLTRDHGAHWIASEGATAGLQLAFDRSFPAHLYGLDRTGTVYFSSDYGAHFRVTGAKVSGEHGRMRTPQGGVNEVWIPTPVGLVRSKDGGQSFTAVPGVDSADEVGFGKAAPGANFPAVFLDGKVQGEYGVFRSDDAGKTWVRITDAQHEYGTRGIVIGDPRIYGRVYLGTNGRGIFYGDPIQSGR